MDAKRFDTLVKSFSAADTRRGLLRVLATLPFGLALTAFLGPETTQASGSGAIVGGGGGRRRRRKARHRHDPGQHQDTDKDKDKDKDKERRKRKAKRKGKPKDRGNGSNNGSEPTPARYCRAFTYTDEATWSCPSGATEFCQATPISATSSAHAEAACNACGGGGCTPGTGFFGGDYWAIPISSERFFYSDATSTHCSNDPNAGEIYSPGTCFWWGRWAP